MAEGARVGAAPRVDGVAADWLAGRRETLNARFAAARRKHPRLDGPPVLAWLARLLPAVVPSSAAPEPLFEVLYDLVLLHLGRGRLGPADGPPATPIARLLAETVPRMKEQIAWNPRGLLGPLANATERLGDRGWAFAGELADVARHVTTPEALLDAGAVLAWRLGEARLRPAVLTRAASLPAHAVLAALGVGGYPEAAATLVVASLHQDAWIAPDAIFRHETLRALETPAPETVASIGARLAARSAAPATSWHLAGVIGGFSGFGGDFDDPPLCLSAGDASARHRFWVLSTAGVFRLDADTFGCACRLEPGETDVPSIATAGVPPTGEQATSVLHRESLYAYTSADSFRVRIAVPERERL